MGPVCWISSQQRSNLEGQTAVASGFPEHHLPPVLLLWGYDSEACPPVASDGAFIYKETIS